MARIPCPSCNRRIKIPQHILEATVRCPHCCRVFQSKLQSVFAPPSTARPINPEASEPDPLPLLTREHTCQHCGSAITQPTRRPSATVVCRACSNKTSVYAVLHRCPLCRQLLESPSRLVGAETECPGCKKLIRVPRDELRKEAPEDAAEFWFGCYCTNCSVEVAIREKDVGSYAICPHCLVPFDVPHAGHYLEGRTLPAETDALDSLQVRKEVTCPGCHTHFPASSAACPMCGLQAPSPSPW